MISRTRSGADAIEASAEASAPDADDHTPSGALAFILGREHELEAFVHVAPLDPPTGDGPAEDWVLRRLHPPAGRPEQTYRLFAAALEAAAAQGGRRLRGQFPASFDAVMAATGTLWAAGPGAVLSLAPEAIGRVRALYLDGADPAPVTGHRFIAACQAAQILGLVSSMSPEERCWFASLAGSAERVAQRQGLPAAAAFVRGRLRGEGSGFGKLTPMITHGETV